MIHLSNTFTLLQLLIKYILVRFRCGSRTGARSGARRARQSPAPRRPRGARARETRRKTRWRTRNTTDHWTPTRTTKRSDSCCANTAELFQCCAWDPITSDDPVKTLILQKKRNIHIIHAQHRLPMRTESSLYHFLFSL